MPQVCPVCGVVYADFRTGYTYADIYEMLWVGSDDSSKWRYKRRHTVLGKWHEIKQGMWRFHLEACEHYADARPLESHRAPTELVSLFGVPF